MNNTQFIGFNLVILNFVMTCGISHWFFNHSSEYSWMKYVNNTILLTPMMLICTPIFTNRNMRDIYCLLFGISIYAIIIYFYPVIAVIISIPLSCLRSEIVTMPVIMVVFGLSNIVVLSNIEDTSSNIGLFCLLSLAILIIYLLLNVFTFEYYQIKNEKLLWLFHLMTSLDILLLFLMIFITLCITYNNWNIWLCIVISFIIVMFQMFIKSFAIHVWITCLNKLSYKMFIEESDYTTDDIYCRLYCYYHYLIYHRYYNDGDLIGFGSDDFVIDEDTDELTLLISSNAKPHQHQSGCGLCCKLLYEFTKLNILQKKMIIDEMMKDIQFSYLFFTDTSHNVILCILIISVPVCIFPYLWFILFYTGISMIIDINIIIFVHGLACFYTVLLCLIIHILRNLYFDMDMFKLVLSMKVYQIDSWSISDGMNVYYFLQYVTIILNQMQFDIGIIILSYIDSTSVSYINNKMCAVKVNTRQNQ
eukprot:2296_1